MRQLLDSVWQRRGTSWVWGEEARNQVCAASQAWSLRQFLRTVDHWPDNLPSNDDRTLVVAGLNDSLDLLTPGDAETWLGEVIKPAILSFQSGYGNAALVFWLPGGRNRIEVQLSTDAVSWRCAAPHGQSRIDFDRILWGQTREYPKEILLQSDSKPAGLFHSRIT